MKWWEEGICRRMQTICNCFSAAFKQAREAEIDVPSKRRFHQMLASEEGSCTLPQDEGAGGVRKVMGRARVGLRTFLDCLYDTRNRVEQSISDVFERKKYRRLPE